jgi:hypothetical protein
VEWLRVDRLLGEHGIQEDTPNTRLQFEQRMEARRLQETDPQALKTLRRGWCLGRNEFKQEMLEKVDGQLGDHHSGQLRRETAEAKGERIISEELGRLGWNEGDLVARRKSEPGKLAIAARLRQQTTLSIKTIAARVHMGTSKSANARLHNWIRQTSPPPLISGQTQTRT